MSNRKIKFRAWMSNGFSEEEFRMYYHDEMGDGILTDAIEEVNENKYGTVLMQYTGLKDKNGVEIYEGDIVRISYTNWGSKHLSSEPRHKEMTIDEYMIDIAKIKVIHYDTNGFYASNKLNGYSETMECGKYGFIEVIGNIYENKDLIK